jgi:hypothetical protein
MKRHEAVARPHPVGDDCGKHRPAPARRQLDGLAADVVERDGVEWVDLDKWSAVEFVELVDLAGLGHRVPLVL